MMPVNGSQEYGCKMCGKKFGESLGDMERHILTEHMQRGDFSNLKTLAKGDSEKAEIFR